MAYIDVKITDLAQISSIKDTDLFLVSHPLLDINGVLQDTPYTSNSIAGKSLSSAIKGALENDSLSINGNWTFHTNKDNLPTQDFKLNVGDFVAALEDDRLSSIVDDSEEKDGWYRNLSTSFVQDAANRSGTEQSLSVMNNSIPNIDFVERAIAGAYKSLFNKIKKIFFKGENANSFVPSYIGEIIHSTTLDTEDKVRAIYGDGKIDPSTGIERPLTKWVQHSDYFLRGSDSGVLTGSGTGLGGQDETTVTITVPKHNHGVDLGSHSHGIGGASVKVGFKSYSTWGSGGTEYHIPGATGSGSISSSATSKSTKISGNTKDAAAVTVSQRIQTVPRYKKVYIWERIR